MSGNIVRVLFTAPLCTLLLASLLSITGCGGSSGSGSSAGGSLPETPDNTEEKAPDNDDTEQPSGDGEQDSGPGTGDAPGDNSDPVAGQCGMTQGDDIWAQGCEVEISSCVPGSWSAPVTTDDFGAPLRIESEHFAAFWQDGTDVTETSARQALETLEAVWNKYIHNVGFHEPFCDSDIKWKATVHIRNDIGLTGGTWYADGKISMGMWIGPGATADRWGLAHEFAHGLQAMTPAFPDCGGKGCGIYESHANFMAHQFIPDNFHCSDMLVNAPHLHYGNSRNRYCNWQFFEYLKDKYSIDLVNAMWSYPAQPGRGDPWQKLMDIQGWDIDAMNKVFGEWAMHNVSWDYQNPDGSPEGEAFRAAYGAVNQDQSWHTERTLRLTRLESLGADWQTTHRFVSPYYWAPQRWGYNIIRLYPEPGKQDISVKFRGVIQNGAHSDWRWGVVLTNHALTETHYSDLQKGHDGELTVCVDDDQEVYLVVMATPTQYQKIVWANDPSDGTPYPDIYRYPYMLELEGAWPDGFRNGQRDDCPAGTQRHTNGGGWATASTPASVYVGPYAQVLGGNVSGNARIEDHAVIISGNVSDNATVGALTRLGMRNSPATFNVTDSAVVRSTFYPMGWFGSQSASGNAHLLGDLEVYSSKSSGSFYGMVDAGSVGENSIEEVTVKPPYLWRE